MFEIFGDKTLLRGQALVKKWGRWGRRSVGGPSKFFAGGGEPQSPRKKHSDRLSEMAACGPNLPRQPYLLWPFVNFVVETHRVIVNPGSRAGLGFRTVK